MSHSSIATEEFSALKSSFIRDRNALLVEGEFTPIFTSYYLHLGSQKIQSNLNIDESFKDLIALFTLYLTSRAWNETHGWTLNLRAPRVNYFMTGNSVEEKIIGRFFTHDVKEFERSLMYTQLIEKGKPIRKSTIELTGSSVTEWIENYFSQSEQRLAKAFRLNGDYYALLTAQPDCDLEWLKNLDKTQVDELDKKEIISPLEIRRFEFACSCKLERIIPSLQAWKDKPQALFGDQTEIQIRCPQCAKNYLLNLDTFSSYEF